MRFIDSVPARQWTLNGTSSADTALKITKSGDNSGQHFIASYVVAAHSGTPDSSMKITIREGTTIIWTDSINAGQSRTSHVFQDALLGAIGGLMSITVEAGGGTVVSEISVEGGTVLRATVSPIIPGAAAATATAPNPSVA